MALSLSPLRRGRRRATTEGIELPGWEPGDVKESLEFPASVLETHEHGRVGGQARPTMGT